MTDTFFVDSGVWHAWFDLRDQWHRSVEGVLLELQELRTPLITSDVILLEYMTLAKSRGTSAQQIERNLSAIVETAAVDQFKGEDLDRIRALQLQFHFLRLSSFDASIVVSAERHGIARLLTIDSEFLRCGRFLEIRPRADERIL